MLAGCFLTATWLSLTLGSAAWPSDGAACWLPSCCSHCSSSASICVSDASSRLMPSNCCSAESLTEPRAPARDHLSQCQPRSIRVLPLLCPSSLGTQLMPASCPVKASQDMAVPTMMQCSMLCNRWWAAWKQREVGHGERWWACQSLPELMQCPRRKAQRCHTRMRGAGARRVACSARGPFSQGVPPATSVLHVLPLLGGFELEAGRKGQSLRSIDSLERPLPSSPIAARASFDGGAALVLLGKRPRSLATSSLFPYCSSTMPSENMCIQ